MWTLRSIEDEIVFYGHGVKLFLIFVLLSLILI